MIVLSPIVASVLRASRQETCSQRVDVPRDARPDDPARRPWPRPHVPITSPSALGEGTDAAVFSFALAP